MFIMAGLGQAADTSVSSVFLERLRGVRMFYEALLDDGSRCPRCGNRTQLFGSRDVGRLLPRV